MSVIGGINPALSHVIHNISYTGIPFSPRFPYLDGFMIYIYFIIKHKISKNIYLFIYLLFIYLSHLFTYLIYLFIYSLIYLFTTSLTIKHCDIFDGITYSLISFALHVAPNLESHREGGHDQRRPAHLVVTAGQPASIPFHHWEEYGPKLFAGS